MRKLAIVLAILVIAAPALASMDKVDPLERPTYDPPGNDPVTSTKPPPNVGLMTARTLNSLPSCS